MLQNLKKKMMRMYPALPAGRKCNRKKEVLKKSEFIDDTDDEGIWRRCREYGNKWDDNSSDCWIVCDICSECFHLQCSSLMYKQSAYWTINLDEIEFECNECTHFFD